MQDQKEHNHHNHAHHQAAHRNKNISRIKNSLKDFALISKNKTMVQKKISQHFDNISETGSSDGISLDLDDLTLTSSLEHAQLFAEKYEILNKLGEGSNGVVHRCIKKKTGVKYAAKSFVFEDEHIPQLRSNFVLVKGLNHRNIIHYEALYLDLKKYASWLVMQLFEAPCLARTTVNSENQIRQLLQQLLQTLHFMHQRAVVHRDIKPQNILYDPATKRMKLIDFGICRKNRRRGIKFQMLTITGTLYYRAPEMFTGGGYTEKVDIWSAGILLYKLITGHTPFESEYHSNTIDNIMNKELILPSNFERYSPTMRNLVVRMLKKDPRERLSALDCLKDLWISSTSSHIFAHQYYFNEEFNEEDAEAMKSPMVDILDQNSYIRRINGDEYHCFDSDDQGTRKNGQTKRFHRSMLSELIQFTL